MSARSFKAVNKEEGTKARWRKRKTVMVGKREGSFKYYICAHTLEASNSEFRFHVCLWPGWSNRLNANENEENDSRNINNLLLLVEAIGPFGLISKRRNLPAVRLCELLKSRRNNHIYTIMQKKLWSLRLTPLRGAVRANHALSLLLGCWVEIHITYGWFVQERAGVRAFVMTFMYVLYFSTPGQSYKTSRNPSTLPSLRCFSSTLGVPSAVGRWKWPAISWPAVFLTQGRVQGMQSYYTLVFRGFRYSLFLFSPRSFHQRCCGNVRCYQTGESGLPCLGLESAFRNPTGTFTKCTGWWRTKKQLQSCKVDGWMQRKPILSGLALSYLPVWLMWKNSEYYSSLAKCCIKTGMETVIPRMFSFQISSLTMFGPVLQVLLLGYHL